jgi:uncharacterized protein DUF6547
MGEGWRKVGAMADDREGYRKIIDRLVDDCRSGQGTIGPRRARAGVWNPQITKETAPEQHEFNELLARLPQRDREVVAKLLKHEFEGGVHATLVALHEAGLPPFDEAYESTPFQDFVGRLNDWDWPI